MNNKGFTLIELLSTIVIIGILTLIISFSINNTMSLSSENAYEILKSNIVTISKNYINECENGLINCKNDYVWENDETSFFAGKLVKHNYFKVGELINPITNKEIDNCLIVMVNRNKNKVLTITLNDDDC